MRNASICRCQDSSSSVGQRSFWKSGRICSVTLRLLAVGCRIGQIG